MKDTHTDRNRLQITMEKDRDSQTETKRDLLERRRTSDRNKMMI